MSENAVGSEEISIVLNGQPHVVGVSATLGTLLGTLGIRRDGVAVAVNARVVPRSQHDTCVLRENDRVEVVQAVGGG